MQQPYHRRPQDRCKRPQPALLSRQPYPHSSTLDAITGVSTGVQLTGKFLVTLDSMVQCRALYSG